MSTYDIIGNYYVSVNQKSFLNSRSVDTKYILFKCIVRYTYVSIDYIRKENKPNVKC